MMNKLNKFFKPICIAASILAVATTLMSASAITVKLIESDYGSYKTYTVRYSSIYKVEGEVELEYKVTPRIPQNVARCPQQVYITPPYQSVPGYPQQAYIMPPYQSIPGYPQRAYIMPPYYNVTSYPQQAYIMPPYYNVTSYPQQAYITPPSQNVTRVSPQSYTINVEHTVRCWDEIDGMEVKNYTEAKQAIFRHFSKAIRHLPRTGGNPINTVQYLNAKKERHLLKIKDNKIVDDEKL